MSVYFSKEFVADFKRSLLVNVSKMLDNPAGLDPSEDLVINETIHPFIGDMKYNIGHLNDLVNSNSQDELLISEHLYHALLNYHSLYKKEIFQIEKNLSFLQKGTREEIYRRLNLAREYIYSNYNQSINLKDLASYSCMSVTHLIRTFKQAYDMTPHQFLMQIRLNRSRLLLRSTNYPINEVVNLIGFDSTSTFIKLFRQRYDTTPLKYRRSNSISVPA
jgi:AraC-like DNA-binding protein